MKGRAFQREQRLDDVSGPVVFPFTAAADFGTTHLLAVNGGFILR